MPDASERIRSEPRAAARARPGFTRALRATDKRIVAAAALAAMMIGIVVNAVALQHGRRAELGLAPAPAVAAAAPAAASAPAPAPPAAVAVAKFEPVQTKPVQTKPADAPTPPARAQKSGDVIADMLREKDPDKRKLTRAAQAALAELGFDVRPTGALDAQTKTALHKFEKSKRLPASTEITAKLVRKLKAAAKED